MQEFNKADYEYVDNLLKSLLEEVDESIRESYFIFLCTTRTMKGDFNAEVKDYLKTKRENQKLLIYPVDDWFNHITEIIANIFKSISASLFKMFLKFIVLFLN